MTLKVDQSHWRRQFSRPHSLCISGR